MGLSEIGNIMRGKQEREGERVTRRNRLGHGLISSHRKKNHYPHCLSSSH